jgi:hypothetical protein
MDLTTEEGEACELATLCAVAGEAAVSGVCAPVALASEQTPAESLIAAGSAVLEVIASVAVPTAASAQSNVTAVDLTLRCGPDDVAFANIGIKVPSSVTAIDYAGCDDGASGSPQRDCASGDAVGSTVDPLGSFTLGPATTPPSVVAHPGVPDDIMIITLAGSGGTGGNLLCQGNDPNPVSLGPLNITNLLDQSVTITTEGFDQFSPELSLLVEPGGTGIPTPQVQTISGPANPELVVELSPALDDLTGTLRSQITVQSDNLIDEIAFGITGYAGAFMTFGDCRIDLGGGQSGCAANVDLGPGVDPASPTHTLAPSPSDPTFVGDTLYVRLKGQIPQGFFDTSLNHSGQKMLLGVVEYDVAGSPPSLTFTGAGQLLGGGPSDPPIVLTDGTALPATTVQLIETGDGDEDADGDMIGDDGDNCPKIANFDQSDVGGRFLASSDGIGDPCQCGDFFGDGIVGEVPAVTTEDDLQGCAEVLAGAAVDPADAARCSVTGDKTVSLLDLIVLDAEQAGMPLPAGVTIEQVCLPAVEAPAP